MVAGVTYLYPDLDPIFAVGDGPPGDEEGGDRGEADVPLVPPPLGSGGQDHAQGQGTTTEQQESIQESGNANAAKKDLGPESVHMSGNHKFHDNYLLKTFTVLFVASILSFFYYDNIMVRPTCDPGAHVEGLTRLGVTFKQELFGQHIAVDGILRALYAHLTDPDPRKALVLCFHGRLGSGKTHTAQLIAKHLYYNHELDNSKHCSPFVKSFVGPRHFLLDPTKLEENQAKLVHIVEETVSAHGQSLFIFDEVDKMPPEIFDVLLPYLDHHTSLDGVDYRKAIFIFLSNTGGAKITEKLIHKMGSEIKKREEISLYDFRDIISEGAFTEQGGLFKTELISRKLVDHYIPFLPLERRHVLLCAKREIQRRNVLYIPPEKIAERVSFQKFTNGYEAIWFAADGCKNIATHTAYFVHDSADSFTNAKPEL